MSKEDRQVETIKKYYIAYFDFYQRLGQGSLNQKQLLEQRKMHIIQKINEFGTYDDLDISEIKEASQREHILKKYMWVVSFHNHV